MTRSIFEVPLTPKAQKFGIQLAGSFYNLTVAFNSAAECWMLSIADDVDAVLANNVPIVTGRDLLAPFGYLGIAGQLIAQTDNDPDAVPTYANLGKESRLYFVVDS